MSKRYKQFDTSPIDKGRAPVVGKRKFIDYTPYSHFHDTMLQAFPYMHETEVSRFMQLLFHEITNQLHEKRHINIPFFGRFFVKPFKIYSVFKNDVWNGYSNWVRLDEPIDDWIPCFEASPYLKLMSGHRYTAMETDSETVNPAHNMYRSSVERWDKFYLKFRKRDQALRECPYSLTTMGWAGYNYERIIKEGLNARETVRLTARDGEVYNIQEGLDGNFKEKFQECYEKTRSYMNDVYKRNIYSLTKKNRLRKLWTTTYTRYLHEERKEDVQGVIDMLSSRRKVFNNQGFFYILKFGYGFDTGERKRIYAGYYFNPPK